MQGKRHGWRLWNADFLEKGLGKMRIQKTILWQKEVFEEEIF